MGAGGQGADDVAHDVPFREALRTWVRIACLSFGGPAGQIAVMHRILVEEKRWIGESRFLHALNFCMLLPGPEAQQLTVYIGWLLHGIRGGLVAGTLFVLPGVLAIMGLSYIYVLLGDAGVVEGLFFGIKAAVFAIVLQAVFRLGSRALHNGVLVALAAFGFVGIYFFDVPFPVIVIAALLVGFLGGRAGWQAFSGVAADEGTLPAAPGGRAQWRRAATIIVIGFVLWLGPLVVLAVALGGDDVFTRIAAFFSTMAVVSFGGAYAVLAWVAQEAVQNHGWLLPGEMLDGLGMAETTPGPLIMVVQFVGFMGAYREAALTDPLVAGALGGLLATWVTFVPCFIWIFLGAPWMESLRRHRALSAALSAVTAAVVGVILNLGTWFGLHVLFAETRRIDAGWLDMEVPVIASLQWPALMLSALALVAVFRLRSGMLVTLLGAATLGVGWYAVTGAL